MVDTAEVTSYAILDATLLTLAPLAARVDGRTDVSEHDLGIIREATIIVRDGRIETIRNGRIDPTTQAILRGLAIVDADSKVVMPGFVDAHTHALFAGNRVADFEALIAGDKPRLGIAYTVEQTRQLGEAALVELGRARLAAMRAHGTTTAEVKSGYALTAEGEARSLRAMRTLDTQADLPHVVATFCGAHALPPEFSSYDEFVDELITRIVPAAAATGAARFADAFCERGFFSPEQCRRVLEACAAQGMRLRIHANELNASGGAKLAAELRCVSADHLNFIDDLDIAGLRDAGVTAVLCPATAEYLALSRQAPARLLLDEGVPVALATDFNPGTCPCYSLQEVAYFARTRLRMSAPEVVAALTVVPARSLEAAGIAGCVAPGRPADLIMLDIDDYRELGYYFGVNLVKWSAIGSREPHVA